MKIASLILTLALTACSTSNPVVLRGEEAKQYDADLTACRLEVDTAREKQWADARAGTGENADMADYLRKKLGRDDLVKRCMEKRGYRVIN